MSRIFQALAKATGGATDRKPSGNPPVPKPTLRMPRLVEWRPPGERIEQPTAITPAESGTAAPRREGPVPVPRDWPRSGTAAPETPRLSSFLQDPVLFQTLQADAESSPPRAELPVAAPPKPATPPAVIRNLPVTAASGKPILPFDLGAPAVNEGYREIRTQLLQAPSEPRVIVVASPTEGDGKTVTAINLAGALALRSELTCVLVDADLRHGDIAASCGLPEGPGLGDYLSGRCRLEDAIIRVQQLPNLFIITSGEYRANPVELLDSAQWHTLVASLRQRFRFVIIDVPPIGSLADYDLAEAVSDGVILVVRQDHTTRSAVHTALLAIPPEKRLGIVMNAGTSSVARWR